MIKKIKSVLTEAVTRIAMSIAAMITVFLLVIFILLYGVAKTKELLTEVFKEQ